MIMTADVLESRHGHQEQGCQAVLLGSMKGHPYD
jgi:hypothetical protein